jgi:hypothetical protein
MFAAPTEDIKPTIPNSLKRPHVIEEGESELEEYSNLTLGSAKHSKPIKKKVKAKKEDASPKSAAGKTVRVIYIQYRKTG